MSTDDSALGFTNKWYKEGVEKAIKEEQKILEVEQTKKNSNAIFIPFKFNLELQKKEKNWFVKKQSFFLHFFA